MNRPTTIVLDLPVGPKPDWEFDDDDDEPPKNIFESCVIAHSLRQSRERWLSSTFPRFSTRARRAADHTPPPHTIQTRGKCDLEIGPHLFPDTVFYEVHYLPPQRSSSSSSGGPSYSTSSWQSRTPSAMYNRPATSPVQTSESAKTTPLASTVTAITPALINQVNSAASSNPTLANLLQLAAAGQATSDQLKTLGLLIQSLATPENTQPVPAPLGTLEGSQSLPSSATCAQTLSHTPPPVRQFDLVVEFYETSYERWIFPRGPVTYERVANPSDPSSFDTVIKARLPFGKNSTLDAPTIVPPLQAYSEGESTQVVTFYLKNTPLSVWDTVIRWVGDEQRMEENQKILDAIKSTERVYLRHRLPEDALLGQLQAAALPSHSMKYLKSSLTAPSRTNRTKRKVVKHKVQVDPPISEPQADNQSILNTKKSRIAQVERSAQSTQIRCMSCKQTDVPLMMGGRFCRPCVDAGRGTPVPPYQPSSSVCATNSTENSSVATAITSDPLSENPLSDPNLSTFLRGDDVK